MNNANPASNEVLLQQKIDLIALLAKENRMLKQTVKQLKKRLTASMSQQLEGLKKEQDYLQKHIELVQKQKEQIKTIREENQCLKKQCEQLKKSSANQFFTAHSPSHAAGELNNDNAYHRP